MSKTQLALAGLIIIVIIGALVLRNNDAPVQVTTDSPNSVATMTDTSSVSSTLPIKSLEKKMYTQATFKTTMGDVVIAFDNANTPKTVENFINLASSGFYNGTKFHRVIKDFMIQGGDPLTKDDSKQAMWGTGGPGYQFDDEIKSTNNNIKGTISMANAGPNTNGSQFFINVADNTFLNGKHTVFGHVISGYDIVEKMSNVQTAPGDRPVDPLVINSVELK
jgi:cyclophilin family peptidyl-prolyl cis-trans isomerase